MNKDALEAAARFRAARRERELGERSSAYWEAAALTSSHEDVREVVRQWQERSVEADFMRAGIRRGAPRLAAALDALVEGWRG